MNSNKYHHNFSDILNFTDEMQDTVDKLIVSINEIYINSITSLVIPRKNFDFNLAENQNPLIYFRFGISLIYDGVSPSLLNVLMQNAYEVILENCIDNKSIMRLQLLIVKESINLFYIHNIEKYISFIRQMVSYNADKDSLNNTILFFRQRGYNV